MSVSAPASGLTASTTYHFQLVLTTPVGTVLGGDKELTTGGGGGGGGGAAVAVVAAAVAAPAAVVVAPAAVGRAAPAAGAPRNSRVRRHPRSSLDARARCRSWPA